MDGSWSRDVEGARALLEQIVHLRLRNKPARKQNLRLRIDSADLVEGLVTARLRHDHVEQYKIDLVGILLVDLDRVQPVLRQQHGVAQLLQSLDQEIPDRLVVVHDQNRLVPPRQIVDRAAHDEKKALLVCAKVKLHLYYTIFFLSWQVHGDI